MRALVAALILTLAIAVTASVFAIWPVVADAPIGLAGAVRGDVNCDGRLNLIDAQLILQLHAGVVGSFPCDGDGDLDGNGRIDSDDARLLMLLVQPFCAIEPWQCSLPGDVDCDGSVTSIDAALVLQVVAALPAAPACAERGDMDDDGDVDAIDAALVLQFSGGLDLSFLTASRLLLPAEFRNSRLLDAQREIDRYY